jgi:hypothetical protein
MGQRKGWIEAGFSRDRIEGKLKKRVYVQQLKRFPAKITGHILTSPVIKQEMQRMN